MMKSILSAVLILAAVACQAQDYRGAALQVLDGRPLAPEGPCFLEGRVYGSGVTLEQIAAITNRADVIALAEEWEEARSRPVVIEHGVEIPADGLLVIQSQTNGTGYVVSVTDDGQIITTVAHASPWRTREQIRAGLIAERDANVAIIEALQALKADCTNAIAEARLIDDAKTRRAATDTAQTLNALRKTLLRFYKVEE